MWRLRFLIGLCVILGLRGLAVMTDVIVNYEKYQRLNVVGSLPVRAGVNGLVGLVFLGLAWGLVKGSQRSFYALPYWVVGYLTFNWLWFAVYAQSAFDQARLGFATATSIILMGFILRTWIRLKKSYSENKND